MCHTIKELLAELACLFSLSIVLGVLVTEEHGHILVKSTDPGPGLARAGSSAMNIPSQFLVSESLWTTALAISGSPWRENSLVNKMCIFWLS